MRLFIRIILPVLLTASLRAQTTVVLQPGATTGYDISFGNNINYLGPDSNSTDFDAIQWTCGGTPCELSSLIRFDLSSIPSNATILNASISFYANYQQLNGNIALGPMYGTNNASYLYPVTSYWDMPSLTWSTQPTYTLTNATLLQQSTSNYQDYNNQDVTAAVQNMVSNPAQNFGWLFKTGTSSYYNSMIFCSSNHPDATKHPKLEITYTLSNCITIRPDALTGYDISYGNNAAYLGPDSNSTDFGAVQWTCGGSPCEMRSLMQFNLSTIPPGSLIQNATLSLFANTQQNNGNIALGPMYGSNNACDLLTITSP